MRRLRARGALWVVAMAAAVLVAGCGGDSHATSTMLVSTQVRFSDTGAAVPHSFLGISTEWPSVIKRTGTVASGPNQIYDRLIANLTAWGDGPPTLRVGGDYQDYAWWNPSGAPHPVRLGVSVDITPAMLEGLALNARATGQRMILGVNLAANNVQLARDEAAAFVRYVPRPEIIALEVGNEPDYYARRLRYVAHQGGRSINVPVRPRGWSAANYISEFNRVVAGIRSVAPGVPLAGPAGAATLPTATQFLSSEHDTVALYTQHAYPLSTCPVGNRPATLSDPTYPTLARLLGPVGTNESLAAELRGLRVARAWHVPMQLTEINSTGCPPPPHLGNSFAAGLWALDQFLQDTALGLHGVNLHSDDVRETPFLFFGPGGKRAAVATPLYYAMLMYDEAVGHGGTVLLGPQFRERRMHGANVRIWAIRGSDGQLRIVVINKDLARSGRVRIAVQGARNAASLIRLDQLAPARTRALAELGGRWIPSPTNTGALEGSSRRENVALVHGSYAFELPRLSAAMLTVPAGG